MKQKIIMLFLAFILIFSLTACGNNTLATYEINMTEFLKDITNVDNQMNKIDPDSEDAIKEMLECMDAMNKTFKELAEIKVPKEFTSIETLADEAAEYMDMALENYTQAFANPASYDVAKGDLANQYFKRALKRKEYIAIILQGGTPEGDDVIISYDEDSPKEPIDLDLDNSITIE
jgi:uncharacterized lipoprotein YehR (DUF1307 family)